MNLYVHNFLQSLNPSFRAKWGQSNTNQHAKLNDFSIGLADDNHAMESFVLDENRQNSSSCHIKTQRRIFISKGRKFGYIHRYVNVLLYFVPPSSYLCPDMECWIFLNIDEYTDNATVNSPITHR